MSLWPDDITPPLPDGRETLERFRAGDPEVLGALYRAWRPMVELQLRRGAGGPAVRDEALRHDLLHEIFLRVFGEAGRLRYDGMRPFGAWLRVIARNVAINWFTAAPQRQTVEVFDESTPEVHALHEASGTPPDAEMLAEQAELEGLVERFVQTLGPEEQQALCLLVERNAGLTTQVEAARRMGTSHTRLRRIERRVLDRFRRWLRGHGYLNPAMLQLLLGG